MSTGPHQRPRPYRMSRRAERIDETRLRIVAAAVELHGSVGPARTTVMGVAERAGVTRATVYRHFPDEAALFEACSAHWLRQQVPPDPSSWAQIADPLDRMRAGLADLYRFYRSGEPMLTRIYRDQTALPDNVRLGLQASNDAVRDLLLAAFAAPGRRRRRLRAALGHAVAFSTWRSLCLENGLTDQEAIGLMVDLAAGVVAM